MCFGLLAGLPAIILGHVAYRRACQTPEQYGGKGVATAGFVLGYASVLTTIAIVSVALGLLLPALAKAKTMAQTGMIMPNPANARAEAQSIKCMNNMKNIGLAFRIYSADHQGLFPFNRSTNENKAAAPAPGLIPTSNTDAVRIFQALANELNNPALLVCPADGGKSAAASFADLEADNISYEVQTGPEVNETNPEQLLARCAVHGHELLCDGSVHRKRGRGQ
jgi:hypothetical protein